MTRSIQPSDGVRPEAIRPVRGGDAGAARTDEVQAVRPVDRVEISSEGRALAGEGIGAPENTKAPTLSVQEVQQRIREGYYDTEAMAESVARRLLESGDL